MSYYKFKQNDIFVNNVKTFPRVQFYIYGGRVYYQNRLTVLGDQDIERVDQGAFTASATHVPEGHVSLHEINVDMPHRSDRRSLIYPFITKQGSLTAFKTISTSQFNNDFAYGDVLTGSYPLSASIQKEHFSANHAAKVTSAGGIVVDGFNKNEDAGDSNRIVALQNTLNYYSSLSTHYRYTNETAAGTWDKAQQEVGLISIPSIFYGSSIRKGSVELNFYVTGSLIGQLKDENHNGELVQTLPVGHAESGSVAGVVLYNEGFLLLTGSWDISSGEHTEPYLESSGNKISPSWIHFGAGANDGLMQGSTHTGSSFQMSFYGITYTPTITMFATAPKGYLNHSNNPTYINYDYIADYTGPATGTFFYKEKENIKIKNTVSGAYTDYTSSFAKQTYISKIGLYDKEKNLIAIAKMATPVKKTENRDLTFKLKLDI